MQDCAQQGMVFGIGQANPFMSYQGFAQAGYQVLPYLQWYFAPILIILSHRQPEYQQQQYSMFDPQSMAASAAAAAMSAHGSLQAHPGLDQDHPQ